MNQLVMMFSLITVVVMMWVVNALCGSNKGSALKQLTVTKICTVFDSMVGWCSICSPNPNLNGSGGGRQFMEIITRGQEFMIIHSVL